MINKVVGYLDNIRYVDIISVADISCDYINKEINKTLLVYVIADRWGTLMCGRTLAFHTCIGEGGAGCP